MSPYAVDVVRARCHARVVATLAELVNGYRVTQALYAATALGIPDLLADASRTPEDLATAAHADADALRRLLRALAAVGVVAEVVGDRFSLTPLGEPLRTEAPDSIAGLLAFLGRPHHWETWGHLLDSVESGENAFKRLHGVDVWTYRAERAKEAAIFDAAMVAQTRRTNAAVLEAYDFDGFRTLVDVGGGLGTFLAAILQSHPLLNGVVFDQPHVLDGADDLLRKVGVADRCQIVGGSFFDAVPTGGDGYLLKSILHDWLDDDAADILRTCRRAMGADATLLVVERVLGPPNEGLETKLSDLNMLVMAGGRERSREEFAALFEAGGFTLQGETPTASGFSVLAAAPA